MSVTVFEIEIPLTEEQERIFMEKAADRNESERILAEKTRQLEVQFLEMYNGCNVALSEKYPHSIFLKKRGQVWFEQNFKRKIFICSTKHVWSVLKSKFDFHDFIFEGIIRNTLKEHLFLKKSLRPVSKEEEGGYSLEEYERLSSNKSNVFSEIFGDRDKDEIIKSNWKDI